MMTNKEHRFWLLVVEYKEELNASKEDSIFQTSDDLTELTYNYNDMHYRGDFYMKEHRIWDGQEKMFLPEISYEFLKTWRNYGRGKSDAGYVPHNDGYFGLETNGHFMLTSVRSRSENQFLKGLIATIEQAQEDQKKIESGEAITMGQFIEKAREHEGGLMGMMGDAFEKDKD